MSLTYRPFSDTSALADLDRDLHMNIPNGERLVFCLSGMGLILLAGRYRGITQWLLMAAGSAMLRRGWQGYSRCYAHLAVDPRHDT
jgi:hypothetical protein